MQKTLFIVSLLILTAFSLTTNYEEMTSLWSAWKTKYDKTYLSAREEAARFAIFMDNYKEILKFNAENHTHKLGLNKFADITSEEFQVQYSGCAFVEDDEEILRANTVKFDENAMRDLPASVDWRDKEAVTPIKDQKACGSCWAFSATGVIEGFYAINNDKLLSFSEQQIVDCDKADFGCSGGWPYLALNYTSQYGLEVETDYPYTGYGGTCKYDKSKAIQTNKGYAFVTPDSAEDLKAAVVNSPVSVVLGASSAAFFRYTGGVIKSDCPAYIDHAVLVVGYTTIDGVEAYIVKNSWGTSWGEEGYAYVSTDGSPNQGQGVCGILYQPVIAN